MDYNKQLIEAANAEEEDLGRVLSLIQSGADVNAVDGLGWTPLHCAAMTGHYDICKTLLEHGAQINKESNDNFTPLSYAVSNNREKIVRLLLEKGADPNSMLGHYGTALEFAIKFNKNADIVDLLIEHVADPNNTYHKEKKTLLHWACENRRTNLVELLLHKGARIEAQDNNSRKPVDIAKKWDYQEIVDMFEEDFILWLRLYHASKQGQYEECEALLEQGALVESSRKGLYCPVAAASEGGHADIVKLLFEKGSRRNHYKDNYKRNPLYLATKNGHKDVVSLLLEARGSGNFKVNGETLLHVAVKNNNEEITRLLIEKEVNPDTKDNDGQTPLHYAVLNGNKAIVTRLLNASANVNLATNKMETPLHLACEGGHPDIAKLLLENGANKEAINAENEKPVDVVDRKISEKKLESIKELLTPRNETNRTRSKTDAYSIGGISDTRGHDSSDLESNDENASGEDSDATVDYFDSKKTPAVKPNFTNRILNSADIEELNAKMARLSSLILELNEYAINVEMIEADLVFEAEIYKNLDRKIGQTNVLKGLKFKNAAEGEARVYEDNLLDLTHRKEESKKKESELRERMGALQTVIPRLKTRVKIVYGKIGRFIDKIAVARWAQRNSD